MLLNLPPPTDPPAFVALTGAQVWTDDGRKAGLQSGQAVVIRGERIVSVGPEAPTLKAWPGARRVALKGGVLLPGLIEGHAHVEGMGLFHLNADLLGTRSLREVQARVQEWMDRHPTGWIQGRGWDQNLWDLKNFPSAKDLDAITGDRPAALRRVDGHATWVNSAALSQAGINRTTPDPSGGRILRDAEGNPSGILLDAAAALVASKIPAPTPVQRQANLKAGLLALRQLGFSGVADMGCPPESLAAYRVLAKNQELPIRVFAYLEPRPGYLERELAAPPPAHASFFQIQGTKQYLDGALGSRGARLIQPYADEPGSRGLWVEPPAEVLKGMDATLKAGYQPAIHVIGDAANRALLEMVAGSKQAAKARLKVRAEHAQIVSREDARRFGQVGLVASVQPIHLADDHAWTPARLGGERVGAAFPWHAFLEGGAALSFGSDAPVAEANPFLGMAAAESRTDSEGRPPGGFLPDQRLTRPEAIRAYTLGNARVLGFAELGSIRKGALADILWVEAPLLELNVEDLRKVKPGRLWVNGREVPLENRGERSRRIP